MNGRRDDGVDKSRDCDVKDPMRDNIGTPFPSAGARSQH